MASEDNGPVDVDELRRRIEELEAQLRGIHDSPAWRALQRYQAFRRSLGR
ncbi:MAG TPA: hypothetical protein VE983_04230 [Solirubrobacteraceae bacterium]|nr:hypothetical protein [Solirubrobacteraceae bacterium]